MTINLERAAMKGRLAELKQEEFRLIQRVEGGAKAMRQGLNTTLIDMGDLEIPQLDEQWDMLKCSWAELAMVRANMQRLLRELA